MIHFFFDFQQHFSDIVQLLDHFQVMYGVVFVFLHFQLGTLYYTNGYSTPALLSLSIALLLEPEQGPAPLMRKNIYDLLGRKAVNIEKTDEGDFNQWMLHWLGREHPC